jgi:kelch-like protein 17 (actinfilin)
MLQLMRHVRMPLMARDFLMSSVEPEPLIRGNAQCKELLLEAMKYHLLPEQRSALASERTAERRPEGMRPYLFAVGAYHLHNTTTNRVQ